MPLKNFKLKEQWGTTTLLLKQLLLKKIDENKWWRGHRETGALTH